MAIQLWRPNYALRRGPFSALDRFEREMEGMFDRFFRGRPWSLLGAEPVGWAPAVDLVDRNEELLVRADLPGLTEKDINLTVQNGNLTIRGERKEEREAKEEDYYCCERWTGSFTRTLALPAGVNEDKINATFKDGVLEVHLPKTKAAEGKKISVKAA